MSFLLLPFYKNKKYLLVTLLLTVVAMMIAYPGASFSAAKEGMNLWLFVVIPSLIPFFIINDMLISLRVPDNIARLFSPVAKFLFNTSGYGAYVFIMSIFSGYPAGARITSQLVENKKITSKEGLKILTFSSTSGPLFIIGAVGSGMLKSTIGGYILFISHILGAVLNGIVLRFFFPGDINIKDEKVNNSCGTISLGNMLSKGILNTLITCGFIGGYIVLFSVIIALLNQIEFFKTIHTFLTVFLMLPSETSDIISSLLETSIEISNGCMIISDLSVSFEMKLILSSFIIAFSGFSIIGQAASLIYKTKISLRKYFLSKINHGILSSIVCYLILRTNLLSVNSGDKMLNSIAFQPVLIVELLLIVLLLLNIMGTFIDNIHLKK
ncbi:hypothetical protein [Fonticella tunisiensis]|nr:hypothetical protein [Fonticella tunisiensis]